MRRGTDLERVDDYQVSRADGDGGDHVDVGVGAGHHRGEPRAEVDLQERVDPGEEDDGLDHDRLLSLRASSTARQRSSITKQTGGGKAGEREAVGLHGRRP